MKGLIRPSGTLEEENHDETTKRPLQHIIKNEYSYQSYDSIGYYFGDHKLFEAGLECEELDVPRRCSVLVRMASCTTVVVLLYCSYYDTAYRSFFSFFFLLVPSTRSGFALVILFLPPY